MCKTECGKRGNRTGERQTAVPVSLKWKRKRQKQNKVERTIVSCQLFFNSFPGWRFCNGRVPYILCKSIYYQCCVCGSGPIVEGLWGAAHFIRTGVSLHSEACSLLWQIFLSLNYLGYYRGVLIYNGNLFVWFNKNLTRSTV